MIDLTKDEQAFIAALAYSRINRQGQMEVIQRYSALRDFRTEKTQKMVSFLEEHLKAKATR